MIPRCFPKEENLNPDTAIIFCLLIAPLQFKFNLVLCYFLLPDPNRCVCSSELLSRRSLRFGSRSISVVSWKRFLSLRFSEPLLENVPYVKPSAEHGTASTGPFLRYTHILRFLWRHHCQSLQMEKGSQIPLLVKRRKCSRKVFLSFSVYPQLP